MRLPKLILVLAILTCALPTEAAKYYCYNPTGQYNRSTDIYDTKENCNGYLYDESYTACRQRVNITYNKYLQGSCVPIYTKTYDIQGSHCDVEIASMFNKPLSFYCIGGDTDFAMRNLQQYYARFL